jgi:murein DD-endopeptidase MepM/ murein hydrolase activator NlpD
MVISHCCLKANGLNSPDIAMLRASQFQIPNPKSQTPKNSQAPNPQLPVKSDISRYIRDFARVAILLPALALFPGDTLFAATPLAPFNFPTANHALFENGGEEKFFVGTAGKSWTTGTFGCVRSGGWQIHEGLDIRCLQRDKHGEPTDPVLATADGTVAYINTRPSLSNYGNYIVLRHMVEGIEIYSLYAHLHSVRDDLKPGQSVKAGERIALMGRTANTREGISKDRAHVHFELNLFANERFSSWYKSEFPTQRNDHGNWNGQNLLGLDPQLILKAERDQGTNFSLIKFIRQQTEVCRVFVRKTDFPWLKRYSALVKSNPLAQKEGTVGYEIAMNFNGVPFELIPRSASEVKIKARSPFILLSVNETEQARNPGRRLVSKSGAHWQLTSHGTEFLDLLTEPRPRG